MVNVLINTINPSDFSIRRESPLPSAVTIQDPSAQYLSEQLRQVLTDLESTLFQLENATSHPQKRLHLNSLDVQMQTLNTLLQHSIVLLQPANHRSTTLQTPAISDTHLQEIRMLFMQITQTLQQVDHWKRERHANSIDDEVMT